MSPKISTVWVAVKEDEDWSGCVGGGKVFVVADDAGAGGSLRKTQGGERLILDVCHLHKIGCRKLAF